MHLGLTHRFKQYKMAKYYVNNTAQANGDHEVHEDGCYWLSQASSTLYLGHHANCALAVAKANIFYPNTANGCIHCAKECHTT